MKPDFSLEPFRPSRVWLDPHAQTMVANTVRPSRGVLFHRLRLDTPDGDFLDLDFAAVPEVELAAEAPLVLLLHGLEGSARRGYACEMYRQLARRGVRSVGLNFRSCSGEMNRTARLYHAGVSDDVAFVVDWLEERLPQVAKGAVGFSLGANTLLKYLGEQGERTPIRTAAVVSPPFDLARVARIFANGSGRLYAPRFLKDLRQKALEHIRLNGSDVDSKRIAEIKTVRDFDDAFTAPVHGFLNADDYYEKSSCAQFLPDIKVPTLIIRAFDDPFFANDVPHAALAENDHLFPALVPHGGHVAFAEGLWPDRFSYWAERQAARFLTQYLSDQAR
ncbi:MAG: alpha/beta fold hydrolase [Candidatus Promineifilaceae bacterium]|nr:alpha/beta fold hydrolase [Candidatus Promineifilaceae bacterium]